jgi:uncharacterized protein (DUF924 family)
MPDFDPILQFWFSGMTDGSTIDKKVPPARLWFNGGRAFDEDIRGKFLTDYEKARAGEYKAWESTARGRLALILIFDQFSRNMFRNTSQAFATDSQALELALRSIKEGKDKELMLVERVFHYMPFMHSELLAAQEEGVRRFEALAAESQARSPHNAPYFENNLKYAREHRNIIAKFGRFPHRNAVLQRVSSGPELAFLKK